MARPRKPDTERTDVVSFRMLAVDKAKAEERAKIEGTTLADKMKKAATRYANPEQQLADRVTALREQPRRDVTPNLKKS